jgi:hypothetical protein
VQAVHTLVLEHLLPVAQLAGFLLGELLGLASACRRLPQLGLQVCVCGVGGGGAAAAGRATARLLPAAGRALAGPAELAAHPVPEHPRSLLSYFHKTTLI